MNITLNLKKIVTITSCIVLAFIFSYNQTLAAVWDLTDATYEDKSFLYSSEIPGSAEGIFISSDGTKLYLPDFSEKVIEQYTLSTAWDISTASYDGKGSVSQGSPVDVYISSDGTKLFMLSFYDRVMHQYTLSTAWDVTSISYDSVSLSVGSSGGNIYASFFSSDGLKIYTANTNREVASFTLSTAWDISTGSYDNNDTLITDAGNNLYGMYVNPDGTKLFLIGNQNDTVYQFTLSTPYDVASASYDSASFSVSNENPYPFGLFFKSDGSKMYVLDFTNKKIHQYLLATLDSSDSGSSSGRSVVLQKPPVPYISADVKGDTKITIKINYNPNHTFTDSIGYTIRRYEDSEEDKETKEVKNGSHLLSKNKISYSEIVRDLKCGTKYIIEGFANNHKYNSYTDSIEVTTEPCAVSEEDDSSGENSKISSTDDESKDTDTLVELDIINVAEDKAESTYLFGKNLRPTMTDNDVLELQKYLNNSGFVLAESGLGSKGNETNYFGAKTQNALMRFQDAHAQAILEPINLISGTGIFGAMTRGFINDQVN